MDDLGVSALMENLHMALYCLIWGFPSMGDPQNGWFTRENPIKMDENYEPPLSCLIYVRVAPVEGVPMVFWLTITISAFEILWLGLQSTTAGDRGPSALPRCECWFLKPKNSGSIHLNHKIQLVMFTNLAKYGAPPCGKLRNTHKNSEALPNWWLFSAWIFAPRLPRASWQRRCPWGQQAVSGSLLALTLPGWRWKWKKASRTSSRMYFHASLASQMQSHSWENVDDARFPGWPLS